MAKYKKEDRISKKESLKVMKNYRNVVADLNDLAWNLSQICKFVENNVGKKELTDAIEGFGKETFGINQNAEEIEATARVIHTAIDGFMETVENCTGLGEVTKRTPVMEFASMAMDAIKDREELTNAVKDWAKEWYAQHEDEIGIIDDV